MKDFVSVKTNMCLFSIIVLHKGHNEKMSIFILKICVLSRKFRVNSRFNASICDTLALHRERYALYRATNAYIRKSNALICKSFAFNRKSYGFIREANVFIREKKIISFLFDFSFWPLL